MSESSNTDALNLRLCLESTDAFSANVSLPIVSDRNSDAKRGRGIEGNLDSGGQIHAMRSSSESALATQMPSTPIAYSVKIEMMDPDERKENAVTNTRITDVAVTHRQFSSFCVRALFKSLPLLDNRQMREIEDIVKRLLGCSSNEFQAGEAVSSRFPISMMIKNRKQEGSGSQSSRALAVHCTNLQPLDQAEYLVDQGNNTVLRYHKSLKKADLEQSTQEFERALNTWSSDHPCRAAVQFILVMANSSRCQAKDADISLNSSLTPYSNALCVYLVNHLDRPSILVHLAKWMYETSIVTLPRQTMGPALAGRYETQIAVFLLKTCQGRSRILVERGHQLWAMQKYLTRDLDPFTLGTRLLHRSRQSGQIADLQQAISALEAFARSILVSDVRHIIGLMNLGVALFQRFKRLGNLSDLEQAISWNRTAIDIIPDEYPIKPFLFANLGMYLFTRFGCLKELGDLEQAISKQTAAVNSIPDRHPIKSCFINNLGNSLITRFKLLSRLVDLEEVISWLRHAVSITSDCHPHKLGHLGHLAESFRVRFNRFGELNDLEQAILVMQHAANLAPDAHPVKPAYLSSLANSFFARFNRLGRLGDLEQAISRQRNAVDFTPDGHPGKPACLVPLGYFLFTRFEHLGELNDLEEAILVQTNAASITPGGHISEPDHLNNLGRLFRVRFERLGLLDDLERAISKYRNAAHLTSDHAAKACRLNNLGELLSARFERLGDFSDLVQAISSYREAVGLTSDDHPHKSGHLHSLGGSFQARYNRLGDLSDLEQAISMLRIATDSTPDGDCGKPRLLIDLGSSFLTRFQRLGEPSDIQQAISRHKDAVDLLPEGHRDKPGYLNNLGASFSARFYRSGDMSDLEQAISKYRDAVDLNPKDYLDSTGLPNIPKHLSNLGIALFTRFERLGELSDLEEAILKQRNAVEIHPDWSYLKGLGNSLRARYQHIGELRDLEEAIIEQRTAVDTIQDDHPDKCSCLKSLADTLIVRFEHINEPDDFELAILLYSQAARVQTASTTSRFSASQKWILSASARRHNTLLLAYTTAISLLPQLAWIGLSITQRYSELVQAAGLVRDAAAAALDLGQPETAVEWIEQGRSIVWGELFHLRGSYEELSSSHPDHAVRLQELSTALEHAGAVREKSLTSLSEHLRNAEQCTGTPIESLEQESVRYRALAIERDKLLLEIRGLPGFERFLLHKEFSQLRASAHFGPVVILNAAENRCDALIIIEDNEKAVHVPLSGLNIKRCEGLQATMDKLLGPSRLIPSEDRAGRPAQRKEFNWESVLSILWKGVVKPVLDVLGHSESVPESISRIFWCPTGPFTFLPIHAAGLYGAQYHEPGHKIFDYVISSYVPTLNILLSPGQNPVSSGGLRFLAVPQSRSDGQPPLPGVRTELESIQAVINGSPAQSTLSQPSEGTVEEVLSLMKEADWVHFACHGVQDSESPSNSGLCLANERRLKLSDMISLSRPRGGLAFLSACQTAMGDKKLSDEAVHIAAGMLLAGYGGVIGTMWSISDRVAPHVAKNVYEELFQTEAKPDYRDAARALHSAVARLRDDRASFVEWVPFIHVGL